MKYNTTTQITDPAWSGHYYFDVLQRSCVYFAGCLVALMTLKVQSKKPVEKQDPVNTTVNVKGNPEDQLNENNNEMKPITDKKQKNFTATMAIGIVS